MKKAIMLKHWNNLPENLPILEHFTPLPYKVRGSTFGACGIRIDGNAAFVDAVLSRLKDLIAGENHVTRLGLTRISVDGARVNKTFGNAEENAEVCYIRLNTRGTEGSLASAIFDRHLDSATERYEESSQPVRPAAETR